MIVAPNRRCLSGLVVRTQTIAAPILRHSAATLTGIEFLTGSACPWLTRLKVIIIQPVSDDAARDTRVATRLYRILQGSISAPPGGSPPNITS